MTPHAPLADAAPAEALAAWREALVAAAALAPTTVERRDLRSAHGYVLARDVYALQSSPPFRCAAMDGFAVQAAATTGAAPDAPVLLAAGTYAPIDTGQYLPEAWDAVLPVELTAPDPQGVAVHRTVAAGAHVRAAGEDVPLGRRVLERGRRLSPYDVALAASCGHAALDVHAPPRVAILPTGEELRPAGSELGPGEAIESNSIMLAALASGAGAQALTLPSAQDDPVAIRAAVVAAVDRCDLLLLLSGSSRGRRDHAASVLAGLGRLVVRGVAQRPGHPVLLAVVGTTPVIGVPGYPAAAAQTWSAFAVPVLAELGGLVATPAFAVAAELATAIESRPDSELLVPVALEHRPGAPPLARPLSRRGSALAALSAADATLHVPAGVRHEVGTVVGVLLVQAGGAAPREPAVHGT
jgi:putative molybdopterin biosynthesis protein